MPAGPAAVAFNITKDTTATSNTVVTLTMTAENIREMFTDTGVSVTGKSIGISYWTNGGRKVLTNDLPETGAVFTFTVNTLSVTSS